jgi:hypothetical protein
MMETILGQALDCSSTRDKFPDTGLTCNTTADQRSASVADKMPDKQNNVGWSFTVELTTLQQQHAQFSRLYSL